MRGVILSLMILVLFLNLQVFGEEIRCKRSTEGKEFWFGFMEGRNDNNNVHYIEVTVTAREATSFSVYYGKSTVPVTFSIGNNSSVQFKIEPRTLAEAIGSETVQDRAIHLVSEKPVNVYAMNWDMNSSDVAVIYPVESLGTSYFTMCFTPRVDARPEHGRNSEFLVVASEDNTTVTITPSVVTDNLKPANLPFNITLNKGEVYQVQSMNYQNLTGQGDLTGSFINSDKPVAVYSGNFSVTIPATQGQSGYNHLYEQIPPVSAWGREFYAVPLVPRLADTYRIMASEDNTKVQIGNSSPVTINKGKYYEYNLSANQPSRIYADKAILVAQFSRSNTTDQSYTGGNGDPFMIILSPVNQSKNDVTFVAYRSNQIKNYSVNVVALTTEISNIELDGALVGSQFKPFSGTIYSYAQVPILSGNHRLRNRNPDKGFLAYVYGYGGYESYGYGVGFNLDLVLDLGQSIDFAGDTLAICKGSNITLDAGSHFDNFLWNTGETTQKITADKNMKYWAIGTTKEGCVKKDSIFLIVSDPPKPTLGNDIGECSPYMKTLNAGSAYLNYEWNTGENTQSITIDKTGEYSVTVRDKYNCQAGDTLHMTIFPRPSVNMTGSKLTCGSKFRKLQLEFTGADATMLANGKMTWNSDKPDKLKFTNKTNTSVDIEVEEWGEYTISYVFVTPDGCEAKNTHTLRFADIPTSKIEFLDNPNDKCKGYSREVKYFGNATPAAKYSWDFGGCVADSVDWNLKRISLGTFNSKPLISLVVEENGCRGDTTFLLMGANPDFIMNTVKSRGCDSATIFFSGDLKVPDDLEFQWNFGDGSPVNYLERPSHFYTKTGSFDVGLQITNRLNGCKTGFTIDDMVKIFPTPTAKIELDPSFCNDSAVVAIYPLNIDSSFCKWNLIGGTTIGHGNDTVSIRLDQQVATISLQVDEFGCKSKWVETSAKRKPFFNFSTDLVAGCQPLKIIGNATSTDQQIVFKWLTDSINYQGAEQFFLLPDSGMYKFRIEAHSGLTGCNRTLTKPGLVWVHPKPEAQFEVDYPVATIEHADLNFTNKTENVNKFAWSFGDGVNSDLENPQHTFTSIGKFNTELRVESEFGCRDTSSMEIEILPFNVFSPNAFRPASDIAENREFMPVGVGVDPEHFLLQIFNRWGELIFESKNPEHKWDGTSKNNSDAPSGNYIWKADFNDIQGYSHSMKGQVLLIR